MLDVPHFIAPMMIRFGSATGSRLQPFPRTSARGIPRIASDRSNAVG